MEHHAYLYLDPSLSIELLPQALRTQSADVQHVHVDSFGIGEARSMKEAAYQRPVNSDQRHFVIVTKSLTGEAQNALLKLFEEPPTTAVFHLVVPHAHVVISTLRSRLYAVATEAVEVRTEESDVWLAFCQQSLAERIAAIAERAKAKDTTWMTTIVHAARKDSAVPRSVALLCAQYLPQRGASKKMLLEYLALATPVGRV